jgi:hypothetical protein
MCGEDVLVPDRSGLQLCSALLDAIGKHPIVIVRIRPLFEREQTVDVGLRQTDDAVTFLVFWGVELPLVHRTHDLQVAEFRFQIRPLEGQLLWTDRTDRNQVDHRAVWLR